MRFLVDNQLPPSLARWLRDRGHDTGRFLWVRLGNCRNDALIAAFSSSFDTIVAAFDSGQTVVELI